MNIYQQELLDHYHHSRFKGELEHATISSEEHNPSCGDRVSFQLRIDDGRLTQIMFQGAGCVISQAAASMLCESSLEQQLSTLMERDAAWMQKLVGIPLGPTRFKCALLPLQALQQGIKTYLSSQEK